MWPLSRPPGPADWTLLRCLHTATRHPTATPPWRGIPRLSPLHPAAPHSAHARVLLACIGLAAPTLSSPPSATDTDHTIEMSQSLQKKDAKALVAQLRANTPHRAIMDKPHVSYCSKLIATISDHLHNYNT